MKRIDIPKIIPTGELDKFFETLPLHAIDCCNWPAEFPYTPKAGFKLFHDGKCLYIKFIVTEKDIKAAVTTATAYTASAILVPQTVASGTSAGRGVLREELGAVLLLGIHSTGVVLVEAACVAVRACTTVSARLSPS